MTLPKARCHACKQKVIAATLQSYSKLKLCVECYTEVKLENDRTGRRKRVRVKSRREPVVLKYGTAEKVQKKDGKAVISEKELSKDDVSDAVQVTKTAGKNTKTKKNVVVTDEDYRQED